MDPTHPPFPNPFWQALITEQSTVATGSPIARRYPADIIPFAGLREPTQTAMTALRDLLAPDESIYITGDQLPEAPGLKLLGKLPGWQMHFTEPTPPIAIETPSITLLSAEDSPAMVALTDAAFPGFFRNRTYTLGHYFGIHVDGTLVAMAGERLALPGYREISAVCTLPGHTGRGYAAHLLRHILQFHVTAGLRSFLHVAGANQRAIELYERLGFEKSQRITFNRIRRT
jgi:ribosomal protein S18 acetylase RimI-like enzyme